MVSSFSTAYGRHTLDMSSAYIARRDVALFQCIRFRGGLLQIHVTALALIVMVNSFLPFLLRFSSVPNRQRPTALLPATLPTQFTVFPVDLLLVSLLSQSLRSSLSTRCCPTYQHSHCGPPSPLGVAQRTTTVTAVLPVH